MYDDQPSIFEQLAAERQQRRVALLLRAQRKEMMSNDQKIEILSKLSRDQLMQEVIDSDRRNDAHLERARAAEAQLRQPAVLQLASGEEIKTDRETTLNVSVITDMRQHCSRCKLSIIAEPLSLSLVDVVSSEERSKAQYAVASAMFEQSKAAARATGATFIEPYALDDMAWEIRAKWLREAASGWEAHTFSLDAIGLGFETVVREAGIKEAKKWPAYTDKRKVFRVSSAKFPPGWVTLSFEARGSKNGQPVEHGYVRVHICPECAPAIFDAANVDPRDPFANGVKW